MANPTKQNCMLADKNGKTLITQQQANIVSLTDSSGGTASNTLAAITGGGANCENATKNAIASLAAKIEAINLVLEAHGLTADA